MEEDTKAVSKPSGRVVSIWLSEDVADKLDQRSRNLGRSRSWLVNMVLRERLGIPPDDFEGQDKL